MEIKILKKYIREMGQNAKLAGRQIANTSTGNKNNVLRMLAVLLNEKEREILTENSKDLAKAKEKNMDASRLDRLRLTSKSITDMANACLFVANLPDPIGSMDTQTKQPNGLLVGKMRIPLGVIAMVYESRPNVTIDAAILCLKAGNAVILRGGSEAIHSNTILAKLFQMALLANQLPKEIVQFVHYTDRKSIFELCKLHQYIDVIIPRGGENMVKEITAKATMPVLKHDKGVPHAFIDESADLEKALNIVWNAKTQRPGVCNALEGLLVHKKIAKTFLPMLVNYDKEQILTFYGCKRALPLLGKKVFPLTRDHKGYEFLDLKLAVSVVNNIDDALEYIHTYGSNHTEIICTNNHAHAQRFLREVDASMVAVNASSRFNDGGELGLGAEIGICTSKLHAYGPMGLRELTTTKFVVYGDGQIRV